MKQWVSMIPKPHILASKHPQDVEPENKHIDKLKKKKKRKSTNCKFTVYLPIHVRKKSEHSRWKLSPQEEHLEREQKLLNDSHYQYNLREPEVTAA